KVTNRIFEEYDIVYSTKRLELKLAYPIKDPRSPITYMEQSIVKKITDNETVYKAYDALILTSLSFRLEDKVFLIIDNEVFPMVIEGKEDENSRTITEETADIATSDSTNISVVTGYSENNRKITRFSYQLTDNVIAKMRNADQVLFRYYLGPQMLTITLDDKKLKILKRLIDKT
ncbi:MAG: hypothetical protein Q7V19_04345, partial [Bacteroidales bacterium]|nr:hypothetical protein [Bacteroidales bacterium]